MGGNTADTFRRFSLRRALRFGTLTDRDYSPPAERWHSGLIANDWREADLDTRYTKVAIWLHWLVAFGIIANIVLAWTWPLGHGNAAIAPYTRAMVTAHKSIGITILALAVLRLLWRIGHRPPPFPPYAQWERVAAHVVHWGLYLVIFAMPISGWVMISAVKDPATMPPNLYFGLFEWPRLGFILDLPPESRHAVHEAAETAHGLIAYLVYLLLVLHLAGAFKHQLQGHRELPRMGLGR